MKPITVFFGVNESGVSYWRGKMPAWSLMRRGLCDVRLFSLYDYTAQMTERDVMQADVVFMPSPTGVEAVLEYLRYYKLGKATVADYDDNLFDCHPLNPGYSTLGLNEARITMPDGTEDWLWKDGKTGFSLNDNRKRFFAHVDLLKIVHTVTTTTPYLRKQLADGVERPADDFLVIPNSIDFNLFKPFDKKIKDHSKLRIGWTASDSHIVEGRFMIKVLQALKKRRNDFQFVILGNIEKFRGVAKELAIEWHDFTALVAYPMKLASLELDIGLCPLETHEFNKCKSALKWSEYSAMSIPSVCSKLEPYEVIKEGQDGLLATTPEEFVDKICLLMDSAKLRKDIASNAFDRNYAEYNMDKNCELWLEAFERSVIRDKSHTLTYKGETVERLNEVTNGKY